MIAKSRKERRSGKRRKRRTTRIGLNLQENWGIEWDGAERRRKHRRQGDHGRGTGAQIGEDHAGATMDAKARIKKARCEKDRKISEVRKLGRRRKRLISGG